MLVKNHLNNRLGKCMLKEPLQVVHLKIIQLKTLKKRKRILLDHYKGIIKKGRMMRSIDKQLSMKKC